MNQAEVLEQVLKIYKFDNPLSYKVQKEIYRAKKRTLFVILKKHWGFTLFIFLATSLFLWVKRFGIAISITKSVIIVGTASLVTTSAVTVGTYYTVKHIVTEKDDVIEELIKDKEVEIDEMEKPIPETIKPGVRQGVKQIDYKIAIVPFEHDDNNEIAGSITEKIAYGLVQRKGDNAATIMRRTARIKMADKMLFGSVVKIGSIYRITAKVVDSGSSKVILYITERAESVDDIENVCKSISKRIAEIL